MGLYHDGNILKGFEEGIVNGRYILDNEHERAIVIENTHGNRLYHIDKIDRRIHNYGDGEIRGLSKETFDAVVELLQGELDRQKTVEDAIKAKWRKVAKVCYVGKAPATPKEAILSPVIAVRGENFMEGVGELINDYEVSRQRHDQKTGAATYDIYDRTTYDSLKVICVENGKGVYRGEFNHLDLGLSDEEFGKIFNMMREKYDRQQQEKMDKMKIAAAVMKQNQ